jgi:hypothetical protein
MDEREDVLDILSHGWALVVGQAMARPTRALMACLISLAMAAGSRPPAMRLFIVSTRPRAKFRRGALETESYSHERVS